MKQVAVIAMVMGLLLPIPVASVSSQTKPHHCPPPPGQRPTSQSTVQHDHIYCLHQEHSTPNQEK